MDPVNVIRAPSLKRGKADERLSDRVSIKHFIFRISIKSDVNLQNFINI